MVTTGTVSVSASDPDPIKKKTFHEEQKDVKNILMLGILLFVEICQNICEIPVFIANLFELFFSLWIWIQYGSKWSIKSDPDLHYNVWGSNTLLSFSLVVKV